MAAMLLLSALVIGQTTEVDHELEKIKECDDVGYDIVAEWPRHYAKCRCDKDFN